MTAEHATWRYLRHAILATIACLLPALATAQEHAALDALTVVDGAGIETALEERVPEGPAILHLWATWCVPCREELPQVDAFRQTLAEDGLADRLVVVSVDKRPYAEITAFLRDELAIGLETLLVTNGNPGATLGLFGYPYTLLIDADHAIVERFPGPINWTDPERAEQLLAFVDQGDT